MILLEDDQILFNQINFSLNCDESLNFFLIYTYAISSEYKYYILGYCVC